MSKQSAVYLTLFGALALAGIVLVLIMQIRESNRAADERESNHRQIQVLGATFCELNRQGPETELKKELNDKGFITISANCQRFVSLLEQELVYGEGTVKLNPDAVP